VVPEPPLIIRACLVVHFDGTQAHDFQFRSGDRHHHRNRDDTDIEGIVLL
jgi:hypothetical protein